MRCRPRHRRSSGQHGFVLCCARQPQSHDEGPLLYQGLTCCWGYSGVDPSCAVCVYQVMCVWLCLKSSGLHDIRLCFVQQIPGRFKCAFHSMLPFPPHLVHLASLCAASFSDSTRPVCPSDGIVCCLHSMNAEKSLSLSDRRRFMLPLLESVSKQILLVVMFVACLLSITGPERSLQRLW